MRKLFLAILWVVLSVVVATPAQAANFEYDVITTFDFSRDGEAEVQMIVSASNLTSEVPPSNLEVPAVGNSVSNITASMQDGREIEARYNKISESIRLDITAAPRGAGEQWSFRVSYKAEVGARLGDTLLYQIPLQDFGDMNVAKHTVSLSTDTALGAAVARGPEPDTTQVVAGRQVLTWESDGPLSQTVGLLFGEQAISSVDLRTTLKNDSWWWQEQTIVLPPDTNQQQVFLRSVQPQPSSLMLDRDGNILAVYNLRPRQTIDVTASAQIVAKNFTYDLNSRLRRNDIPQAILDAYTAEDSAWVGSDKVSFVTDEKTAVLSIVESIYEQVAELPLNDVLQTQSESIDAETSLQQQAIALSGRLIGELRQDGVPSRMVLGKTYGDGSSLFEQAEDYAWVEAYVPGVGWITLDPLFERSANYFGVTDVQRVGLAIYGDSSQIGSLQPSTDLLVRLLERGSTTPTPSAAQASITASTNMFFPGIGLRSITISLPDGVIVDGTGATIGDEFVSLGSLAPLQQVNLRSYVFAASAFASPLVAYGLAEDAALADGAVSVMTSVNYLPMIIVVIGLVALTFIVLSIRKRRSKGKATLKRSKENVVFAHEENGGEIERVNLLPTEQPIEDSTILEDEPRKLQFEKSKNGTMQLKDAESGGSEAASDAKPKHARPYRRRSPKIQ